MVSSAARAGSGLLLDDHRILTGTPPLDIVPAPPESVRTLPQLFAHWAKQQPNHVAFSCQTDNGLETVTYAEADAIARSLAARLQPSHNNKNATAKAPVIAIWLEKGLELILSILATTYSGATWLPFDPDVPVDRAAVCVLDSSASAIICDSAHLDRVREVEERVAPSIAAAGRAPLQVHNVANVSDFATKTPTRAPATGPSPRDAAYLIYTSGTTGTPKGISIPHSAALTFSLSEREVLQTGPSDVVWNGFSPAFDMFIEEMWVTIAGGGHLAIGTREECRDVGGLPKIWESRGVTVVNAVPTLIGIMGISQVDSDSYLLPPSIRLINLGGEACPPALVSRLARPGLRIVNTYGPTETTVTATWDELQPDVPVTIGRPLPSYHACILPISDDGLPVPLDPLELGEGVEGELAIGGKCVGNGYVGREELTAQKFIAHALAPESGERLYRTGDRVKLQSDLKLVFLGRIDTQVKHRGFRIELGEIESRLSSHPDVQAAAVILANAGSEAARLEAFIVTRPGTAQDVGSIQQVASQHLPSYMRPEEVYFLNADEMPRLPSGKINSKALHELSVRKAAELAAETRNEKQDVEWDGDIDESSALGILLTALASVLKHPGRINPEDDFFDDLGGHSLVAAMLVSRLRKEPAFASVGLPDIYEGRTPMTIASRFKFSEDGQSSTIAGSEDFDETEGTGPQTGDIWPVSQTRFVLCGLAQIFPLLFFWFLGSIEILVPYLLFDFFVRDLNSPGWAILAAYGVFVVSPLIYALMAIVGKWLVLGKVKEGEYPLYGGYYFRWWLAQRFAGLANAKLISDSPIYPFFLRAMGCKVGDYCHLGATAIGAAADLVEIGDDVIIGSDVLLGVSVVERGRLILKRVVIEKEARIGSNTVIEGGAIVSEGADIGPLSMVPDGMRIPSYQRFHGSPARFERELNHGEIGVGRPSRPSKARAAVMALGHSFISILVLPLLYLVPQIPGLMLFNVVDLRDVGSWAQVAILSMPITFAYQVLLFAELIFFRRLVLGKLKECKMNVYSFFFLRKWFVDRLMDLALAVLHPVFATLYIVPFLRALGVRIGHRAEVSTARGLNFELLEIGEESFVADAVLIGDVDIRANELTLKKTKLESRAFAGNVSLLPQGTTLASGTLVGVLSVAPPPEKPLVSGTSCFGSPPVLMPARQRVAGHNDNLLFRPSKARIAARLTVEGIRIVLPRAMIVFGLGFALQIAYLGYNSIGGVYTLLMLPLFYFFLFALPALFITCALKWILIGRYKPAEWPLWSLNVWLSEFITSTWETVTMPLLTAGLTGTPYLAMCFRLFGVKIGKRVTLLHSDITEHDCVTIGDEAVINGLCGAQTHLFEDRIMKIGRISFGERSTLKPYSICLPGSSVSDGAQLGSLSLVMKGETLPENTAWEGAPVVPRAKRRRGPLPALKSSSTSSRTLSAESSCSVEKVGSSKTSTTGTSVRKNQCLMGL